jgi:hypothetical protein
MTGNNKAVMAGLVAAIRDLEQPVAKIVPGRVRRRNKPNLAGL